MDILNTIVLTGKGGGGGGGGLTDLKDTILDEWLGPLFIVGVAAFALVFIKDRAWMKLIGFVGIAAVVGVLVFAGDSLFGNEDSGLTGVAKGAANEVGQ